MGGLSIAHPGWIAIGVAMIAVGVWLIRWANRNNLNGVAVSAAAGAALSAARNRGRAAMPSEITERYADVASASTHTGKVKKIAGFGLRHAAAQVFGIIGFIVVVAGLMAVVLGVFYV